MPESLQTYNTDVFCMLDEAEMLIGYMDGFAGTPLSNSNRSQSYRHGWKNGMIDSGFMDPNTDHAASITELYTLEETHERA